MAFDWECEAYEVALAPWSWDLTRQRTVCVHVAVAEQRTPDVALRFDLTVQHDRAEQEEDGCVPPRRLMRLVTQRQMLCVFEFAFVGAGRKKRRPCGNGRDDERVDIRLHQWLVGGGQVRAPSKEELVRWLLAWMVVTPGAVEGERERDPDWSVLLCGEKGMEDMVGEGEESALRDEAIDASEFVCVGGTGLAENEDTGDCDSDTYSEDDESPPPYEVVEGAGSEGWDRGEQRSTSSSAVHAIDFDANISPPQLQQRVKRSSCNSKSQSLVTLLPCATRTEQDVQPLLKPAIVHLTLPQDAVRESRFGTRSDEWMDGRRQTYQELRTARRNVRIAKAEQDRGEKLACSRHYQSRREAKWKERTSERAHCDALKVRRSVTDMLEHCDEERAMETQLERGRRYTRVGLGNSEKTFRRSLKLERERLLDKEMKLRRGISGKEAEFVYDLDGRRHSLNQAGLVAKAGVLANAMRKVRRGSRHSVKADVQHDGTFGNSEVQRMLREESAGDSLERTEDQTLSLENRLVDGGAHLENLLWDYFFRNTFSKRWDGRKNAYTSDREVKKLFTRYDPDSRGVVSLEDFQLLLDHLGVNYDDTEVMLLALKYHAGKDGSIDYCDFLNYVKFPKTRVKPISRKNKSYEPVKEPNLLASNGSSPSLAGTSRILVELQELSSTQAKLRRLLKI